MRTFIATVAILCVVQLPGNHAKVRIFEKSFARKDRYDDLFFMNSERLIRVAQDEPKPTYFKIEQLTIPYEEARYSCKINVEKYAAIKFLSINPFDEDKLIILQLHAHEGFVSIFHFPKCRIIKEVRLPRAENNLLNLRDIGGSIMIYKDTFEVFIIDATICGERECKVTFDTEGNLIAGPVPIINHKNGVYTILNILPVAAESPEKRYVYDGRKDGVSHLSLLHPNGTETVLVQGVNVQHINTNNGHIGACYYLSYGKNVTCAQYDNLGHIKVQTDFSEPDKYVIPLYLYNLPEGGFLTLVTEGPYGNITDISVRKVNAFGEQIGKISFKRLDETKAILEVYLPEMFSSRTQIWKDEESEQYCVALIGKYISGGYGLNVNCFDDFDSSHSQTGGTSILGTSIPVALQAALHVALQFL